MGPILDLLSHRTQGPFGPAFNHSAHRIGARGLNRGNGLASFWCWLELKHRAQDGIGSVSGQSFESGAPSLQIQVLEIFIEVVGRHIHRLRNRGVYKRLNRCHHGDVFMGRHLQRTDKLWR